MNAIMASLGGRAPPGQNMLTPYEESRSPAEARGSRAQGTSASRPCRLERQPACRSRPPPSSPTPEASATCSRSWLKPKRSSPSATDAHVRDPAPAAPRGNEPQAKICCLSDCSWLHPLKSWSLRQTRGGSIHEALPMKCNGESDRFASQLRAVGLHGRAPSAAPKQPVLDRDADPT